MIDIDRTKEPFIKMNYREALNKTFEAFDIKASDIAKRSGLGENQISNYRNGKSDLYSENLQLIINTLPIEAKMYFYGLLLQSNSLLCA